MRRAIAPKGLIRPLWAGPPVALVGRMTGRPSALLVCLAACGSVTGGDSDFDDFDAGADELDAGADAAFIEPNLAFITSTFHAGDLGGLAGADAVCNQAAADAGLPGVYAAWLSTETTDARDRFDGASGWVRPDGLPFAASVAGLISGRILYPPRIDQTGADQQRSLWTATAADGTYDGSGDCGGWTSAEQVDVAMAGTSMGGMAQFTSTVTLPCSFFTSLLCLGIDRAGQLPDLEPTGKLAFVSRGRVAGSAGRPAFDALCQSEATDAGLSGNFLAAVSMSGEPIADRFGGSGTTWQRVDGVELFGDIAAGDMRAPLQLTADGTTHVNDTVWTGAQAWDREGANCSDFLAGGDGLTGRTSISDSRATAAITANCGLAFPVYCFEQ